MDGGSSRIDPSSDNFDLLFKLIIIGDTGGAARLKCPGSQRLTRPPTSPQAEPLAQGCPERSVPAAWSPKRACVRFGPQSRLVLLLLHGQSGPLAAPALGSCACQGALSGLGRRALREQRPAHPQPLPRLPELSASQVVADCSASVVLTHQARASRACCTSSSSAPSRGARRTRSASSSALGSSRSAGRSSSCRSGTPPARLG